MNFYIDKVVIWAKNKKIRVIQFKPNAVNVITGESNTGKTTILDIIDYCLFSSRCKFPESIINENVAWYGLVISINNALHTIARKAPISNKVSSEYYFSSLGEIPENIEANSKEALIKPIIETAFTINNSVVIPFGGKKIKAGSKISLRYFLMFNTISANIIESDNDIFFDHQDKERYREALPRIFDIALGIETVDNILKKEKKDELEDKLAKIERKVQKVFQMESEFQEELTEIVRQAKEYSIISADLDKQNALIHLNNAIHSVTMDPNLSDNRDSLERDYMKIKRKIANIRRFSAEYTQYKNNLKNIEDNIKPVEFLNAHDHEIIKTSIFDDIIKSITDNLAVIKKNCSNKTPIDIQINDLICNLESESNRILKELNLLPKSNSYFQNNYRKYYFLGQTEAKLSLYGAKSDNKAANRFENKKLSIEKEIQTLNIISTEEQREIVVKAIEEIILDYIGIVKDALDNYSSYLPFFDYKNKSLKLKKPKSLHIENVGSSSNHMFLQLFFSLAIHAVAFESNSPFIAPFIVMDQPSRPYFGTDNKDKRTLKSSDESKIKQAFKLLDYFVTSIVESKGNFQMIVFEHIPSSYINDLGKIHIVEEFSDGNALITAELMSASSE